MAKELLPPMALVSAVLFVSSRPLSVAQIAEATALSEHAVQELLVELGAVYSEESLGVTLAEVAGKWQLRTAAGAKEAVERLIPASARKLSRAAAETLAVIAYKQPVQKAEIDAIRGVDSFPTLKTLLEARLVRVIGHDDRPGQPALYATTERFLEKFGLKDLADLPDIREVQRIVADPGESETDACDEVEALDVDDEEAEVALEVGAESLQ